MQLISLNTWGGQLETELAEFLKKQAPDTDVFCLQEVFQGATRPREVLGPVNANLYEELVLLLDGHTGYYAPSQKDDEGLAIFIKSSINVKGMGDIFVHGHLNAMTGDDGTTIGRNIQYVIFEKDGQLYTIVNFHGLWSGGDKKDTAERLEQSHKVKGFLETRDGKTILCGDFNLEPETQSMAILEKGMRNLIKQFGITSTRTHHYTKPVKLADYMLVSPDVEVSQFIVLEDIVSDHLPLLLRFS